MATYQEKREMSRVAERMATTLMRAHGYRGIVMVYLKESLATALSIDPRESQSTMIMLNQAYLALADLMQTTKSKLKDASIKNIKYQAIVKPGEEQARVAPTLACPVGWRESWEAFIMGKWERRERLVLEEPLYNVPPDGNCERNHRRARVYVLGDLSEL